MWPKCGALSENSEPSLGTLEIASVLLRSGYRELCIAPSYALRVDTFRENRFLRLSIMLPLDR